MREPGVRAAAAGPGRAPLFASGAGRGGRVAPWLRPGCPRPPSGRMPSALRAATLGVKFSEFLSLKNSLPFKASLEHGQNQRVRSYFSRISNSALQHYLMGDFLVGHCGTDAGSWWTLKQLGLITKLATFPNFPLKSYLNRGSFSGVNLLTHHCGQGCLI